MLDLVAERKIIMDESNIVFKGLCEPIKIERCGSLLLISLGNICHETQLGSIGYNENFGNHICIFSTPPDITTLIPKDGSILKFIIEIRSESESERIKRTTPKGELEFANQIAKEVEKEDIVGVPILEKSTKETHASSN